MYNHVYRFLDKLDMLLFEIENSSLQTDAPDGASYSYYMGRYYWGGSQFLSPADIYCAPADGLLSLPPTTELSSHL